MTYDNEVTIENALRDVFDRDAIFADALREHIREDNDDASIDDNDALAAYVIDQDGMDAIAEAIDEGATSPDEIVSSIVTTLRMCAGA